MKKWIKKHRHLYEALMAFKNWIISYLTYVSPMLVSKIRYRESLRRKLDLKNPQEFNEKLMWLKLNKYDRNPLVIQCADKVRVRKYVEYCGCKEILIECLGIYKNVEEILWDELPRQFVLKCNHGAGYNIICEDKNKLNQREAKKKLSKWLKQDYSRFCAEMQYHYIKPLIICERYLKPVDGFLPDDYKVYCFQGRAECIMVCKERETGTNKYYFFDREWNWLKWNVGVLEGAGNNIERPECLEQLLLYAEKLSKEFPFVRVDFYVLNERIYFGEMTFTPCGCADSGYTKLGNQELSRRLKLS